MIYYKKYTIKPIIHYDDAVEEAICFGWIDSIIKRIDDEKYARKSKNKNLKMRKKYLKQESDWKNRREEC